MGDDTIYVYDSELLESLKLKHPNLDVRAPDGTEPPLVVQKVFSIQQISLPYRRDSKHPIEPKLIFEVGLVRLSYENLATACGVSTAISHASGINGFEDIVYKRLEVGTIVGSYQSGEFSGNLTGNYVTPTIGATLDELGVPPEWADQKTHFALFEVIEEHFVLDTIAAPFLGTGGGAKQFFLTEIEHRAYYKPAHFGQIAKLKR